MRILLYVGVFTLLITMLVLSYRWLDGYVMIVADPYQIKISLVVVLIASLLFIAVIWYLSYLYYALKKLPQKLKAHSSQRENNRQGEHLRLAMQHYFEGNYLKALKSAEKAWKNGQFSGMGSIIAALASHRLGDENKRLLWLDRITESGEQFKEARLMIEASMLAEAKRHTEAEAVLNRLRREHGVNNAHLLTALTIKQGLGRNDEVVALAEQLHKRGVLDNESHHGVTCDAHLRQIRQLRGNSDALQEFYRAHSKQSLSNTVVLELAKNLNELGDESALQTLIENRLPKYWDNDLVILYGELHDDPEGRLRYADRWAQEHKNDPEIHQTLGRIHMALGNHAEAEKAMEQALSLRPSRSIHLSLAELYDATQQPELASKHLQLSHSAAATAKH